MITNGYSVIGYVHIVLNHRKGRMAQVVLEGEHPAKVREELGWSARTNFEELMHIMVEADLTHGEKVSGRRRGEGSSR